ncbi:hypothetical protein F2Q70_00004196 [Brassica cretica]|uniref:Uncharacterized protein n=1 Tax=Brassica cretica TaxID=69181 RepID=A0A8S9J3I1_BRACR|nr:hypothetical protein F2Q70_00004196 [Brassica cretica]
MQSIDINMGTSIDNNRRAAIINRQYHTKREVNKGELEGFHKRVKRVPKDMSFEDAYHNSRVNSAGMIKNVKVKIGECIISVDFHAVDIKSGKTSPLLVGRAFMATVGGICDLKRNKMCLTNVDEAVFYDPMEKKKKSASVDIRIAASVDFQSSESIDNPPSASDDSQSSESIDTKPSASVDTFRLSEQPETEKSKSGGRNKNRKKKKKRNADADSLSVVPLQCQEGSLQYRVRCRGGKSKRLEEDEFARGSTMGAQHRSTEHH